MTTYVKLVIGVLILSAFSLPRGSRAADTYTCQRIADPKLDGVQAAWTQLWQINDDGQIAAGTNLGGAVYDSKTGLWTLLPAPPLASGYSAASLSAIGINAQGVIVGNALTSLNAEQGFILTEPSPGLAFYDFVPPYASPSEPTYTNTEFRGINDNKLVTGQIQTVSGAPYLSLGFIFNPTGSGISMYQPGYTPFTPMLSDGSASTATVMGRINTAAMFVGSAQTDFAKEAFVCDPDPSTANHCHTWTVTGAKTAARGINDLDPMSSSNCQGNQCVRIVGFAGSSAYYVDFDPAKGAVQVPQVVDCSAALPLNAASVAFQAINNQNVISGVWLDDAGNPHGLVAYPNVVLPSAVTNGRFVFDVAVAANSPVFLDPPIAVGYAYEASQNDPPFGSVTLPIGVAGDLYKLLVDGHSFALPAGQRFDFTRNGFTHGVNSFRVTGISPSAKLSPTDTTAFVTEVTFLRRGRFNGAMTPLTVRNLILSLERDTAEVTARLKEDAESIELAHAASNVTVACRALTQFSIDLRATSGSRLSLDEAAYLSAQAAAIAEALGC
jgi:hypothetical protein